MNSTYFNDLAKEKLTGNWNKAALIYFVYSIILAAVASAGTSVSASTRSYYFLSALSTALTLLLSGPMYFGIVRILNRMSRHEDYDLSMLFVGFKERFGMSIALYVLRQVFLFLWALLLLIPAIVKFYGYRLAFYLMHDDASLSAMQAIKESDRIMRGNKWRLFCLDLSYLGWYILGILTLGILFFWIIPKHELAAFEFYKELVTTDEQDGLNQNDNFTNKSDDNPYSGDYVL